MRKLKLAMQLSIDGFVADINGRTDWMVWAWGNNWLWDDALRQYHTNLTLTSDCVLLSGNMAQEGFINHWANVASDAANPQAAFAQPITNMQKVVFSKTINKPMWPNTVIAQGDMVTEVNKLKMQEGKDMIVYGGASFVSALISKGLIDEFHLFINPTVLGNGLSIFDNVGNNLNLNLVSATPYPCGVLVVQYALKK
jgi:dihydrofolate reductase